VTLSDLRERAARSSWAWWLLLLGAAGPPTPAEPTPILQASSGTHPIEMATRLEIAGVRGTISLRLGPPGAMRFEARSLDATHGLRAVKLGIEEDGTLVIGPVSDELILLDVLVSPEVKPSVSASQSKLLVGGLHSDLEVTGEKLEARIRGVQAHVRADVVGGTFYVEGVTGLELGATDASAEVTYVYGTADLDLLGGSLRLEQADEVDAYLEGVQASLTRVSGRTRVTTLGGALRATDLRGGGELTLEETALELRQSAGDFVVETDAALTLLGVEGTLVVRSRGAKIEGKRLGAVTVESDGAPVVLEEVSGACDVRGTALELSVVSSKETVNVHTAASHVEVKSAEKPVTIENEFGDVEVAGAKERVEVRSRQGTVRVVDLEAALVVTADGPAVEASWVRFNDNENSKVHNESGDLRVRVPASSRCFIEASAPRGRVESGLANVPASEDGHSARGEHTGGARSAPQVKKPTLQLTSASGDVYLGTGNEE
jgi:hypothetical protein